MKKLLTILVFFAFSGMMLLNAQSSNIIKLHDAVGSVNSTIEIEVEIINDDPFTGFQFDMLLQDGFTYVPGSIMLTGRENGHGVQAGVLNNPTRLRVITNNPFGNVAFTGNSGVVAKFTLNTPSDPGQYPMAFYWTGNLPIISSFGVNIRTGAEDGTVVLCDIITIDETITDVSCYGSTDGQIEVNITGGFGVLEYSWTGPNEFTSDEKDISGLAPGNYTLTATDVYGCEATETFTVGEPEDLPQPVANDEEVCYDGNPHSASATAIQDATIVWYTEEFGGEVTTAPTGTNVGTYTAWAATVKNGCEGSVRTLATLTILELPAAPVDGSVTAFYNGNVHSAGATPPAGSDVKWYDAPTGGNETTAPTETNIGIYTAWAASVDNLTNCESDTRTEVTLTIQQLPGDANCDGFIDILDIEVIEEYILNATPIPCHPNADVNNDDEIDLLDIELIQLIIFSP